ncbi:PKD domain-containing protein [Candidatus Gottesmanbacteria bacterium]|nr:PKD domain-containing protein [Candidatus Gottesmanbacteria bacterium]
MKFFKKYWHLLLVSLATIGLGLLVFITSRQISQTKPVAPTVPQRKPKAAEACTLAFAIGITPTVTVPPTATPTPTPTATPTPTPTPKPNDVPDCTGLSASPSSGDAPLTVNFTCSGIDRDGDITAVQFQFGDGKDKTVEKNVGSPGSLSTTYTYPTNGSFSASCRVRDNNFVYSSTPDACKKTITVGGGGTTTTTTTGGGTTTTTSSNPQSSTNPPSTPTPPVPKVPVSGAGPSVLGISTIVGGAILLLLGLAL